MVSEKKPGFALYRAFEELLARRFRAATRYGINLSSGNPAFKPFAPAVAAAEAALRDFRMQIYGNPHGDCQIRKALLPFCEEAGLAPAAGGLTEKHILPGMGSTHLYACVVEALARKAKTDHPGKTPVLLMTSPTYGLFAVQPEPFGFEIETVSLTKEEQWQTNPDRLNNRIREINASGSRFVCAFYRNNPNNPLGVVEPADTTQQVSRVLRTHNVFGIDDLAYIGQENGRAASPFAHHDFENSVSLFTLSKTYGLPGLRAGFMCGPEDLIQAAAESTMRTVQSMPWPAEAALAATFSEEHRVEREQYTAANRQAYLQRYEMIKALVEGIDSVQGLSAARRQQIEAVAMQAFGHKQEALAVLKTGLPGVDIVNTEMTAGYFAVLNIRDVGERYYGAERLTNSFQLAAACIDQGKVLTLPMMAALAGPELRGALRVTFGLSEKYIALGMRGLCNTLKTLTEKPNGALQDRLVSKGLALGPEFQ